MLGEAQSNWITTWLRSIRISLWLFLSILALEVWITRRIWSRRWISTLLYDFFHLERRFLFSTASWVYCTHCPAEHWQAWVSLNRNKSVRRWSKSMYKYVYYKYHSIHLACTCVAPPWLDCLEPRNIWSMSPSARTTISDTVLSLLPSVLGAQEIEAHHLSDGKGGNYERVSCCLFACPRCWDLLSL